MHQMITGLEQRCGNTTKLVNIAQQCTLELRNENESKLQTVANNVRGEHYEMHKLLEAMSSRISAAEQVLITLPSLVARMDTIEAKIAKNEVDFEVHKNSMAEKLRENDDKFQDLNNVNISLKEGMEKVRADLSRNCFNIEENEIRTKRCFTTMEEAFQEELKTDRDEANRKLEVLTSNMNFHVKKLHADSVSRESGCLAALRLHKESSAEALEILKADIAQKCNSFETDTESRFSDLNTAMQEGFGNVDKKLNMTGNRVSVLSTDLTEHKENTAASLVDINTDMDDLYDSIDEIVSKMGEVEEKTDQALTTNREIAHDLSRVNEDIAILDRILGEIDEQIAAPFRASSRHHYKELPVRPSITGPHVPSNDDISSPSESEDDRRGVHVDSQGRPILDYIGAGLYSGVGPQQARLKRDHVRKMVTSSSPQLGTLKRSVSFEPVMRQGSPPAKRDKLGYIGSGIYWDRSQPFDKHLVLEMLQDMKDSDSVDPLERAELLYAAQHNAESPPDDVRALIRAKARRKENDMISQQDNYVSRLVRRDSHEGESTRSEASCHSSNSKQSSLKSSKKSSEKTSEDQPSSGSVERRSSRISLSSERKLSRSASSAASSSNEITETSKGSKDKHELPPKAASPPRRRASMSDLPRRGASPLPEPALKNSSISLKASKTEKSQHRKTDSSIMTEASKVFRSVSSVGASSNGKHHGDMSIASQEKSVLPYLAEEKACDKLKLSTRRLNSGDEANRRSADDLGSLQRFPFNDFESTSATLSSNFKSSELDRKKSLESFFTMSSSSIDESSKRSSVNEANSESQWTSRNHSARAGDLISTRDHSSTGSCTSESTAVTLDSIQERVQHALRNQNKMSAVSMTVTSAAVPRSRSDLDREKNDDNDSDEGYVYESEADDNDETFDNKTENSDCDQESADKSRSLMDMSGESIDHLPVRRDTQLKNNNSIQKKGRNTTKSGRVRLAQRSVSPHLTMKSEYFYLNDVLAAEVKAARTAPHDRVPERPWVPTSSTVCTVY